MPEPEPTINVEFKVSELRKIVNVWLQFTRFAESVYFLIRALGLLAITADQLELRNDCDGHYCGNEPISTLTTGK